MDLARPLRSAATTTTASGKRRSPRPQRLKDTCDMCAASKTRCDRQKPTCSRCERLSYPCFYSPARRVGRPQPESQSQQSTLSMPPQNDGRAEVQHAHITSFGGSCVSLEQNGQANSNDKPAGSSNDSNDDAFLHLGCSSMSHSGEINPVRTGHCNLEESQDIGQRDHRDANEAFNFEMNRPSLIKPDRSLCQMDCRDNTTLRCPSTYYSRCSTSSTVEESAGLSGPRKGPALCSAGYDCATLATNALLHLNAVSMKRSLLATPHCANPEKESKISNLDTIIATISMVVKRLSVILVCPCSQKTEVGLLATAVCAAILDVYEILFRNAVGSKSQRSSLAELSQPVTASVNCMKKNIERTQHGTGSLYDDPNDNVKKMRIIEELSKVASLVLQFSMKCSSDARGGLADFFPALAASLKTRVKSITNEATNWLVQD